jgi:tetratricopeptide (TPR) repeat protein
MTESAGGRHRGSRFCRVMELVRSVLGLGARPSKRAPRQLATNSQTEHVPNALDEPCRSEPATVSGAAPPVGSAHTRASIATRHAAPFSVVRVDPEFGPGTYATTFAELQRMPSAKLLDLTPARRLSADVFDRLGDAWTAPPKTVPRLGVLLSFERWVMMRHSALTSLQQVVQRGVRVNVFYEEQASGGHLGAWFRDGQVFHNLPAVVATLALRWEPSAMWPWPMVIDTLARLIRSYAGIPQRPALLTDVAGLALSCGGAEQAARLAREAVYYLPEVPSATRAKALRELGVALMSQGQSAAGLALLDQAIAMSAAVKDPAVGASALCQAGLFALNRGDYPNAERRFRRAIDLLSPPIRRPQLLAQVSHNLAIALMNQGKDGAEFHARTALALRSDPQSHLAEQDRLLLSQLREVKRDQRPLKTEFDR